MLKENQIEADFFPEVERAIVSALLKGEKVVVPDFGYLESKFLSGRRTVLFKSEKQPDYSDKQVFETTELEQKNFFTAISAFISTPLKEGKVVSSSKVGVFRPVKKGDEDVKILFTPSTYLRQQLNGEGEEISRSAVENVIPIPKKEEVSSPPVADNKVVSENYVKPVTTANEKKEAGTNDSQGKSAHNEPLSKAPHRGPAKVGDVIVPQEDVHASKRKNNNLAGWLSVAAVVVTVIVFFVSRNKSSDELQPVLRSQSEYVNLPAISEQHYGNPAFWVYIFEANKDKLISPVNIPKDMVINIPDLVEFGVDVRDSAEIQRANMREKIILEQINN
ncbi:MAG: hypothetical protein LBU22_06295 [Dysgonamonadaceae bacterium]|jgi:nucleoid DNA-binding protein|nr:hypothetical protein [Dysgonamonadaceae bacterium]